MNVIDMSKRNIKPIELSKDDGTPIKKIFIGLNWDENKYVGEADIDLDLHVALLNSDGVIEFPEDVVNHKVYNAKIHPWATYSGDNRTGNDSKGVMFNNIHYDESIVIDTTLLPNNRTECRIALTIFRALQRLQNFSMVQNATLIICDYENPNGTCWRHELSKERNFETLNAVMIGKILRDNTDFRFKTACSGYENGTKELYEKEFGLIIDEKFDVDKYNNPIVY